MEFMRYCSGSEELSPDTEFVPNVLNTVVFLLDIIMEKTLSELNNYIDTGKAENFYTWTQWRRVRDEVLKLDNYECQACKQNGRHRRAEVVHHIKHLKDKIYQK